MTKDNGFAKYLLVALGMLGTSYGLWHIFSTTFQAAQ